MTEISHFGVILRVGFCQGLTSGDFLRERYNSFALAEIHRIEFPSALITFKPEQYSFIPVLRQLTSVFCASWLRSFYSPHLFLQPCQAFILPSGLRVFHWLQGPCRASWLPHCWSGCCWCPGEPACYWLWELLLGPVLPHSQCCSKKGWGFSVHHCPPGREERSQLLRAHHVYHSTLSCLDEAEASLKSHPAQPQWTQQLCSVTRVSPSMWVTRPTHCFSSSPGPDSYCQ